MCFPSTEFLTKEYLQSKHLNFISPLQLQLYLSRVLLTEPEHILVLGDITNRSVLVKISNDEFEYFPLYLQEISSSFLEIHNDNILSIDKNEHSYTIKFKDPSDFVLSQRKPLVKLISLFHQENFPLPRFPLGISDIAAAIRRNYLGSVIMSDMQFGKSISDIAEEVRNEKPDIMGVSATFGQHDLIESPMAFLASIPDYSPLVVFGGSLSALNSERLLEMFPNSLVAKGYGETTMQDVIKFWLGLISKEEINFISYLDGNKIITTEKRKDDKNIYANPELDLLEETLKFKGVMQLESSRGCTYQCSFCPRSHKGQWLGETGNEFQTLIPFVKNIFDKHPGINKKIFLVDEEFVGYKYKDTGVENRAVQVAELLKSYGFKFESSTRIDQVYRPSKADRDWHIERIRFWRKLIEQGLDRMLFGVESGVDSILTRFNKHSTAEQNVIAIRMLTTIGIPLRLTYITFDPLMTLEELISSYEFQGRKDVLLNRNDALTPEEIFEAVFDENYVSRNSSSLPLYGEITYMLVSMESLIGSNYLKLVENAGLAEEYVFSMGKRRAKYKNEDVGLISLNSQRWIDKNFAVDYLLKSIIKISNKDIRDTIMLLRMRIKDYSYSLLGKMLTLVTGDLKYLYQPRESEVVQVKDLSERWKNGSYKVKDAVFLKLLEFHFELLKDEFKKELKQLKPFIKEDDYGLIEKQVKSWASGEVWELINNK